MQRVPGPVDDRLEQLVPCPGRRREARNLVEEPELGELICLLQVRARFHVGGRHVDHDTSVEKERAKEGCGSVQAGVRNGVEGWVAA